MLSCLAGNGRGSGCGRPQSAVSSCDGRDTPLRLGTPSSLDGRCHIIWRERGSRVASSLFSLSRSSVLSGGECVSLNNIDSAVHYLRYIYKHSTHSYINGASVGWFICTREALEDEISRRREDIAFLQRCSEGESDYLLSHSRPLPSLRELREVGTQLEREVMSATSRGTPHTPSPPTPPPTLSPLPRPPQYRCVCSVE